MRVQSIHLITKSYLHSVLVVPSPHHSLQVKEEEQLLLFALKHAENFEPLGRWIELQLESNPALAAVRDIAAERCMSSFLLPSCTF